MVKRRISKNVVESALPGQTRLFPSERLLDMPLAKGRVAKGMLVFGQDAAYLQLNNLEEPLLWKLDIARTAKSSSDQMAESFSPLGSRHVHPLISPNSVNASAVSEPLAATVGKAVPGLTEFGMQLPDDKEYFLSKFGDLVGVLRVQRKEDGQWKASLSKSNVPRVLSAESVAEGLMPPRGHSGLPKSLEAVVPTEYQYWKSSDPEIAKQMRDTLVEEGFFNDDCIKAVDGELRKVEVKYFIYEPQADVAQKRFKGPPTLGERVTKIIPERFIGKGFTPMTDSEDWLESLDKNDADGALAILSPVDRSTSPREMARAVKELRADYLLEHDDTRLARAAFSRHGVVFKLIGEPTRLFCSSFVPDDLSKVALLKAAFVKTVEVQGLPVFIDRPKGYVQTGKDADGNEWSRTYLLDYGFLPRTKGGDGEELDVFIGPDETSERVFWVTQNKADGTFDEYKVFVGFTHPREARDAYVAHIPAKFYAGMSETPIGQLKALAGIDPVELAKRLAVNAVRKVSGVPYDEVRRAVNAALTDAYPPKAGDGGAQCAPSCGPYCEDIYDDHAIFSNDGKLWSVGYTYAGGTATLTGQPAQVVRTYQPAEGAQAPAPDDAAAAGEPAPDNAGVVEQRHPEAKNKRATKAMQLAEAEVSKRQVKIAIAKEGDEHYVLGIVLEPDVVDAQQDTYSVDEVRMASERFMEVHRNMGLMHKGHVNDKVQILENYLAPCDMTLGDTTVKKGTWLMGCRVKDDTLWAAVKAGGLTGFSIGGSAIRTPAEQGV